MENFGAYKSRKIQDYFRDPRKIIELIQENKKNVMTWVGFFLFIFVIFKLFSSGDFSFVLTLGSLTQMFGFILIAIRSHYSKTISGISKNTIICYTIGLFSRLVSIINYEGYLPYDSSGDFIYRFAELVTFFSCSYVLYLMVIKYKQTYNQDLDIYKWYYFAGATFILSIMFHPSLNNNLIADVSWTFALYLEAFSMFPQIDLFRKKGGEIEKTTGTFVASTGISKFLHFVFWLFTFSELNDDHGNGYSLAPSIVGYFVILFQFAQLAMIIEFLYFYFKSINSGIPLLLPQSYDV